MKAEEVYVGQIVRYKEWAELESTWPTDRDGDLRIVNSDGRVLDYMFKSEKSRCGIEYVVRKIIKTDAEEGCFVKLNISESDPLPWLSFVHNYKLDPVEQEDFSFDETGFLSMLGVGEGN